MNENKEKEDLIRYMTNSLLQLRKSGNCGVEANRAYNRILVNKAHLKKEMKELSEKEFGHKVNNFIKKIIKPKKERLICDYFQQ